MHVGGGVYIQTAGQAWGREKRHEMSKRVLGLKAFAKKATTLASIADKHACYQEAVQCPRKEVRNLQNIYLELRNEQRHLERKGPLVLREDFCGTAILCKAWAELGAERDAIGVDLDEDVLAYGRKMYGHERVELVHGNVLSVEVSRQADIVAALNYGVCYFHRRSELISYLQRSFKAVANDGIFVCDVFGGLSATKAADFRRQCSNFVYTFEQTPCNPLTNLCHCYIHFAFPDGTALRRAFSYEFRVWSLVELREALLEVGFRSCHLWVAEIEQDEDGTAIGSADFRRTVEEDGGLVAGSSWNAYVVATRF